MFEIHRASASHGAEFGFGSIGRIGPDVITAISSARLVLPSRTGSDSVKPDSGSGPGTNADEAVGSIAPGGTVSGVVDTAGDVDYFNINLVAGQTYLISLVGSGATPLLDTELSLTSGGMLVAYDDDGGQGAYSLLTFTATTTGTYQIQAEGYQGYGLTGGYTIDVRQMSSDAVGSTFGSSTSIGVGRTFGFIETSGDVDMYAITLVAGQYYTFNLDGGVDYQSSGVGPGELDTVLTIYDSTGAMVGTNDDAQDLSSAFGFVAPASGTYYVQVAAWPGNTGGYVLNVQQSDLAGLDPLDSLDTGLFFGSTVVTVYFVPLGETLAGVTSLGWSQYEMDQAMAALQTYATVSNLTFTITTDPNGATFRLLTTESDEFLGYFNFPGTADSGIGVFSVTGEGWNTTGGLLPGGYGFVTLVHEFGHGLGLGHPHDELGAATVMAGVTAPFDSFGVFDLNQGIFTTMSYNDGWQLHPSGPNSDFSFGWQAGPGALDIAVIQQHYGASTSNTGDNVYVLPTANAAGTFWDVIWDTGGTDTIQHSGTVSATIDLTAATLDYSATGGGAISFVNGIYGGFTIAAGVTIENATGGSGADIIVGNSFANTLRGQGGNDTITGGLGADTLTGGAGADTFRDTAAGLSGDTITDFALGDRIVISNASLGSFTFSLSGTTLTYSGGSLTFGSALSGTLVASTAAEGGVQLVLNNTPPPPPPPPLPRAALTLTESGQDFIIGGDVLVYGTTSGGEVIEVLHGDVLFDASFNIGGDTVVLPGNAGTYTATLSGSFVTIEGGGITVAIPVGASGLSVQFADSTRTLRFDTGTGQVLLGTQPVTATTATVEASGPALVDPVEVGPDGLGRLVLAEAGQDIDLGGNASIFGSSSGGEVITVLSGTIMLDASFNIGGDTVVLPGNAASYTAALSGSFVTIAGGDISIAIPVGVNGLTVDFADADRTLRFDAGSGQVMLGDQVVSATTAPVTAARMAGELLFDTSGKDSAEPLYASELADMQSERFEFNDSFCLG